VTEPAIEVRGLTKHFGNVTAVESVDFVVRPGEILGLLGPNGAGKTTTILMMLGITTPSAGSVRVLGLDLRGHRRRILSRVNFSSAYVTLPFNLTAWENLNVFAGLYGVRRPRERILQLLEVFGIPEARNRVTGALSTGQLTRLNLCKAFLNDPEVLFLDEPTASLDPDAADTVRRMLRQMQRERGVAMVYTSHNMREVETMCDRVIFLRKGRIVAEGPPAEIAARAERGSLEEVFIAIARDGTLWERGGEDS
jgi:ABC-2 type transport system ATP-binding protein